MYEFEIIMLPANTYAFVNNVIAAVFTHTVLGHVIILL